MKFEPFDLEYSQSVWEQEVDFNLTESGVHPITLQELIADDDALLEKLLGLEINYPHVNGIPRLRELIASLYDKASPENVLVTIGAAEANQIIMQTMLAPGDEIATLNPTYKQVWGIALNAGHTVKCFSLDPNKAWSLNTDELDAVVSERTKIIAVVNPNNPTGKILTTAEMQAIINAADKVGAWILADEVYRGAEREQDEVTPSFFNRYDKVLAVGSMSKAYGLPGLRIGWVVAPPETIEAIWRRHEYTNIAATMLSNHLAAHALSPEVRPRLINRARNYIRNGFPVLQEWMDAQQGLFSYTAPQASAVSFIKYNLDINSTELMLKLIKEASVFIGAGDSFGMDHHMRIAFGQEQELLEEAFTRIQRTLENLS
ncbi:MAG: aminotransferase class I/II-fold pyridoxal phosphate-dependent enzyme [Gammaproteobacteria bacterium]|nr:aminotransferase class I/II-fold pyridoxal phosphate-dependent enzyme [Gammaproteobacteria bacterium]MDD9958784.1 aminotransferase class I/II-fold pyridoxal phosphate-dependent enzyme [Gammaproteobacteria bacterium]